ncbi:hypothetical protein PSTG_04782 [Puccinia striiformis f. sp. tritici PST-78]|uniref:Uncharacterized protein n=1 Tax=Puccinia striiformis f. sp. tritici PST-78 TaxID=1165861 RepID=A0A0L0VRR6_9BASI|nr:hypothetical protein PSTG_04782 [Puccinia striiformis f. sp. tritici PST-78]
MDWDTFKSIIKDECSKTYAKIPQMIEDATNSSRGVVISIETHLGQRQKPNRWPIRLVLPYRRFHLKAVRRQQAHKDNARARKRVVPSPAPTPSELLTAPHAPSTLVSHLRPTSTDHSEQIPTSTLQEVQPSNNEGDESGDDNSEGEITGNKFSTKVITAEEIYALYPFDPADDPRKIILTTGNVAVWSKAVMEFRFILPPGLGRSTGGHINQYNIPRGQVPSAVDSALLAAVAVQMANQFSQMHNPASMGGEPVTPVNPNLQPPPAMAASGRGLLTDYLRYVGITNIDATLATLATHKIHHYEMFKPDFLSLEQLEKLGLGVGTLGKLCRHVVAYELSPAENAQ